MSFGSSGRQTSDVFEPSGQHASIHLKVSGASPVTGTICRRCLIPISGRIFQQSVTHSIFSSFVCLLTQLASPSSHCLLTLSTQPLLLSLFALYLTSFIFHSYHYISFHSSVSPSITSGNPSPASSALPPLSVFSSSLVSPSFVPFSLSMQGCQPEPAILRS